MKRLYDRLWERVLAKLSTTEVDGEALRQATNDVLRKKGWPLLPEPPSDSCQYKYPFSDFCRRQRLEGSNYCLWHHRSTQKYEASVVSRYFGESITFREAIEREVSSGATLSGAYLEEAPLGGNAFKRGADLHGADLRGANLRNARLSYGTLRDANLAFCNLESAYLGDVDLRGALLSRAKLFDTKFRNNDFTGVRGLAKECFRDSGRGVVRRYRILETYPEQAEPMYRALMSHFAALGALDDASWAAYRYRVMHHAILRKKLSVSGCIMEAAARDVVLGSQVDIRHAFEAGFCTWVHSIIEFLFSSLNRLTWGYGEKPIRVAVSAAAVILVYAVGYAASHALTEEGFLAALYFSAVTFTTLGYGDILPRPSFSFRLFAVSEALLGLLVVGLFLFTLSRRSVGRA